MKVGMDTLAMVNKKIYNVKYILPLGKEAFIDKLQEDQKYELFYTNDDISDIYIPEKYRMNENLQNQVCWIIKLSCNNKSCTNSIELGPKAINGPDDGSCYKF